MNHLKHIGIGLCTAMLIAGCSSQKEIKPDQLSGYLGDYSKLEPVKGKDNEEIRRWVDPSLKKGEYLKLIVDPIVFYPEPKPSKQVSLETLNKIRDYTNLALQRELAKSFLEVQQAGPGTARLRIAFTGVTVDTEELSAYEYIPIAAIAAGVMTAAGERERVAYMMVEAELTDSVTGKKLAMAVRKIPGNKMLKNDKEQLTEAMMKSVIDNAADSARRVMDRVLK
jgi:hypothetical protein